MAKYIATKDIKVMDQTVIKTGEEIDFDEQGNCKINTSMGTLGFNLEFLKDGFIKKQPIPEVKISILEDEDKVQDYRLQLDVKTTRKKAREIEKFLRETLESMI